MTTNDLTLLLIEDNPGDARLIEELLAEARDGALGSGGTAYPEPREMRHASTADDGFEHLEEGDVDVILLDLGLPDSTGIDTLERVRAEARDIPIVVLTGLDDETVAVRAVQQGAQEYLTKDDLTPTLLRRSIRHAIERKGFERTQSALHGATRELIGAESKAEASQLAVDTAVDVLDVPGIAISLFDDSANALEPAAYTEYVEETFSEAPSFGSGDTAITWQAFIAGETIAFDDVRESEHAHRRDTPLRSGIWIPLGDHGVLALLSEEVGGFDQRTDRLADHLAATTEAALDRVEREEALRDQERELSEQNSRLEELNRMNEVIRGIDQVLVQATTREEIERAVCDLLTSDDRFAFAWIGEVVDDERVRPRTWTGTDQGYLDAIEPAIDDDDAPPAAAAATGAVALEPNVAADLRSAPWRKAALTRGLQSAVSVPLTYADLSYGVLTVFASEPGAFDESARDVFSELGETIANAMNAVETRQTLLTDTVVELELAIRAPDDVLVRVARDADCDVEYGGIVPQPDGTVRVFIRTSGAPPDAIRAVAENVPSIRGFERISDSDGADGARECRFETAVAGATIPSTLVECGAVAKSISVSDSDARVVVELPDSADVRTFVNRLEETYPDTELIARRDSDRATQSPQALESLLTEELTDRQLETLQTAYHSGYFAWPRERSGVEVAESLDITQPTFNGHLRSAERKLFAMLFDGASAAQDPEDQHT